MDIKHILNQQILGIRIGDPIVFCVKVFIIILVAKIIMMIVNRFFHRAAQRDHTILDLTARKYFQRIIKALIYVIAISSILVLIPGMEKLGNSILTSAGILAAAIGLASQEALSNFIGGLFIIISKPFRVGDFIQLDNYNKGTVKEITLRHTVIVNAENRTIYIPNRTINSSVIVNSSAPESSICAYVEVGVAYTEDLNHVFDIMRDEIMKHPLLIDKRTDSQKESGEPQVIIRVISLDDSAVKIRALAWAASNKDALVMQCELLKNVKERFDKEGIEIPYPYYNVVQQK